MKKAFGILVALLFLLSIIIGIIGTPWISVDKLPEDVKDMSGIERIGTLIFTDYVLAFEVLSLVLLASLIGAAYMARKEEVA